MRRRIPFLFTLAKILLLVALVKSTITGGTRADDTLRFPDRIDVVVPHVSTDTSVTIDYDIVYVRALRAGDEVHKRYYTDFSRPVTMEVGADLMLLHPDGSEELLVAGGDGSITDPMISFDGEWVYYTHILGLRDRRSRTMPSAGADIFKIHVPTRRTVRLTNQRFTPNTGAARWSRHYRRARKGRTWYEYGVFNMGPCPLPGGKVIFTSNRDGFRPARGYPGIALQLFVMDDSDTSIEEGADPVNLEKIGHLNISGALHPVVLRDGRVMYSTLESQGIRASISWGIWTIRPDGTGWAPLVSAFDIGGAPNGFHFQTQMGDGSIVIEEYYNQNNSGFGAYVRLPATLPAGVPAFGPAYRRDPRNKPWRYGRFWNTKGRWYRKPFMPTGSVSLTPFSHARDGPSDPAVPGDKESPRVGKFTHPSGAPDAHLLTVYSPGPVNHRYKYLPQLDGGIYLIKNGAVIEEPADMRLIKNDPLYNESWPRALVPYRRVYGVAAPKSLPRLRNDGSGSRHLPAGAPFGLVGTSSVYKRESYPDGVVPEGKVTAQYAGGKSPWKGLDAFSSHGNGMPVNWHNQGADAGLYSNDEIWGVRVLVMEPTTDRDRGEKSGRWFYNHAEERLRILGEIPVRKRDGPTGQIVGPDGYPDTSFLVRIPADTAFTFQTIDQHGMLLNASQTWHQLRPGEVRTDCGGCHAHSQQPTPFEKTVAGGPDFTPWDLAVETPLKNARSPSTRSVKGAVVNVEYHRDVRPILDRYCVSCHTKSADKPAGNLVLDADDELVKVRYKGEFPGTYYRLALDEKAQFGHKPIVYDSWGYPNASRYIRKFQSRRSLLVWKLFGRRLDGFSNDDHPSPAKPGDRTTLVKAGSTVDLKRNRSRWDLDYRGRPMPPPAAVREGKVPALDEEDRLTLVRWIDLGCPIDLDYKPLKPELRGFGWMLDDNRPILTLETPAVGRNDRVERLLIGFFDYYSGIDESSLEVVADFQVDDLAPGENLAARFRGVSLGVKELRLTKPIERLETGRIRVSLRDRQGNETRIDRVFSVGEE